DVSSGPARRSSDLGPARRDVLEALPQEGQDLVPAAVGLEEVGPALVEVEQEVAIAGEPEEPVALLHPFQGPGRVEGTAPVRDLGLRLECLAPDAVPPLVRLLVEVAGIPLEDPPDQLLDPGAVGRDGGPDELV